MQVFTVVEVWGGVTQGIEAFAEYGTAKAGALELARELDLLNQPPDWQLRDGAWDPERGSTRYWKHHWYDDERDVVVAECAVG
jgi:hypothetical protein